jgi:hypothetical protein
LGLEYRGTFVLARGIALLVKLAQSLITSSHIPRDILSRFIVGEYMKGQKGQGVNVLGL